ncbi:hypothetical protein B0T10DRAFT_557131 [Thelonectria olida]|uniref:Uncharacterized protein n=1 Tax=Thelonectria olida TaxID=1576542 RepID=A0A9P9AUG4_9HYPO|nr:hypothetical protein B0T10DRAFT_557131 [Thelonectria olida]
MRDVLPWMVAHISCILAHFVFFLASTYAFISPPDSEPSFDRHQWALQNQRTKLTWMSSAAACFTMFPNASYLMLLWKLEQRTSEATGENRRFVKKTVIAIGTTLNCAFMFADFAIAKSVGAMLNDYSDLAAMRVFAVIAGITLIATVAMDLWKAYELHKQNDETYQVLNSMEPEDEGTGDRIMI